MEKLMSSIAAIPVTALRLSPAASGLPLSSSNARERTPGASSLPYAANDSFERTARPVHQSTNGFGAEQLTVISDGARRPMKGEWIYQSEVKPALELVEDILSGNTSLHVEEMTEPWLCGLIFRRCPGFKEAIEADLRKLSRSPIGRKLLLEIANHPSEVVIRPTTSKGGGLVKPKSETKARRGRTKAGEGSGSTVYMPYGLKDDTYVVYASPGFDHETGKYRSPMSPGVDDEIAQPRFIVLGHELVHVHRGQRGTIAPKGWHRSDAYHNQEEYETIDGEYRFTENRLRSAHGLPERYGHFHHKQ